MRSTILQVCRPSGLRPPTLRIILLSAAILVVVAAPVLCLSGAQGAEPDVLANVNGYLVTRAELRAMLADPLTRLQLRGELGAGKQSSDDLKHLAVQKLIARRLVLEESSRRRLTVSRKDVDQAMRALQGRFKDTTTFQEWLRSQGLSETVLRQNARNELLMARVKTALAGEIRISDEEAQKYYEAHKQEFRTSEEVRLRLFAVKDKAAGEQMLAALRDGEDFHRLARVGNPEVADMDWVALETLGRSLRRTVSTLEVGEIGGPVEGKSGFFLVRLVDRRPVRTRTLAEVRPEIEQRLIARQQREVLQGWLGAQRAKATIEVFLP